jgi:phosphoglycerol transferase MdoB-like AlkP superfamily enzyme
MADYIRAGQAPVNNGLAFMLHPTRVLLFSTLLFVLLVKRGTRKWLNIFLLICSSVLSILLLLAMDGRFMAAMFFVMLFFCAADIFGYKKITRKIIFI